MIFGRKAEIKAAASSRINAQVDVAPTISTGEGVVEKGKGGGDDNRARKTRAKTRRRRASDAKRRDAKTRLPDRMDAGTPENVPPKILVGFSTTPACPAPSLGYSCLLKVDEFLFAHFARGPACITRETKRRFRPSNANRPQHVETFLHPLPSG